MAQTTLHALRFPAAGDPANVPVDMQELAEDTDRELEELSVSGTATASQLSLFQAQKAQPNGLASLGPDGKVVSGQLPVGIPGPEGPMGPQGPIGIQGPVGPTGSQGQIGLTGPPGAGVQINGTVSTFSALPSPPPEGENAGYMTADTGHLWVWDGDSWFDAGLIQGAKGEPGVDGTDGAPGAQGPQGIQGPQGDPGTPALPLPLVNGQWLTVSGGVAVWAPLPASALLVPKANSGAAYTPILTDAFKLLELNHTAAITLTVPPYASVAFPDGTQISFVQVAAGQITVAPGAGVTLNGRTGLKTAGQWSTGSLIKRATNVWLVVGDLVV